ncbi:MAG: LamG domain-containing protein, partial [Pirellulales bacterium]
MMPRTRFLLGCLVIAAISAPAVAQDITSNLGGNWKLVETSGATAVDSSSTANNGTYTNGVTLANSTPVPVDSAVAARFDGSNDYVAIPNEAFYDTTGAMTVAAWIKVNSWTVADQAIVTKGDLASARLIRDGSNNGVAFVCRGLTTIRVASTTSVNDGKWHHVAGVFTGSQLRIYIDGLLNNSVNTFGFISTNNFPVQIGSNAEVAGKNFNGWIYDARLYTRALSAADISYLCLQGTPVGHWKLNETSGTTAADSSLYGSNGTAPASTNWVAACGGTRVFDFNGLYNYITIPNAANLQPSTALTIAGWIKGDAWSAGNDVDTILRKGEDGPNNYALAISDGRVELLLDGNDATGFRGNTVLST